MRPKPELRAVTSELPEPPYPATVKAGTFAFELDWARIKASKTWRLCPPDLRNHLLRIWAESWNEVPAGSWEDDVEMIAAACDIPVNLLVAHRGVLLRNWVRHSDGRLYHPIVTARVMVMEETRAVTRNETATRRASLLRRIPRWSEDLEISRFYKECPHGYHVDHIIPLRGKNVSGLHVMANLQYLPAAENLAKGSKFDG